MTALHHRLALAWLMSAGWMSQAAAQNPDLLAIRKVQSGQAEAWNRHDATAYASLFTPNGDVVNVVGWWWQGRAEIERKLQQAFTFVFRESQMTIEDVRVRFLSPTVALAHVRWTMTGARTPRGIPEPREGIQTQVLQKQSDGRWLIAAFQNTNSVPERPFPTGPVPRDSASARPE